MSKLKIDNVDFIGEWKLSTDENGNSGGMHIMVRVKIQYKDKDPLQIRYMMYFYPGYGIKRSFELFDWDPGRFPRWVSPNFDNILKLLQQSHPETFDEAVLEEKYLREFSSTYIKDVFGAN
ncbi:MAG: hypothetical protein ACQEUT_18270 [Bacillota bacterium]